MPLALDEGVNRATSDVRQAWSSSGDLFFLLFQGATTVAVKESQVQTWGHNACTNDKHATTVQLQLLGPLGVAIQRSNVQIDALLP
jgi:hypothetical protein